MKTPNVTAMLDVMSEAAFGRTLSESIANGICVSCGKPKGKFKDFLSEAEYKISGMCQSCQDDFDATFADDFDATFADDDEPNDPEPSTDFITV